MITGIVADVPLSQALKAGTQDAHARLDDRIMAADPFGDRRRYAGFLRVQHRFHQLVAPLYDHAELTRLLPDLARRPRLAAVKKDMADLGIAADAGIDPPVTAGPDGAIGWLYVAEGSSLGAAFLLKAAAAIGLDADHGARHLAGHEGGRAHHWRSFVAAIDALPQELANRERTILAARDAFGWFRAAVGQELPVAPAVLSD